ncbi:MAG TPA: D-glycerate dehydrogenase [Thermomicrobiales bacterium]|nr:D-glycerate dehydrogenase [Thermomicrobiales bacterium]
MPERPIVVVTREIPQPGLDLLAEVADVRVWPNEMPPTPDELDDLLAGATGALTLLDDRITGEVLDRHPDLRVVANYAVGYDNIDVDAATERGVAVCNTPEVLTETTAEFAFALLLATARRVVEAVDYVRAGKWHTWGPQVLLGQNVVGATLGIVGFGRIGKAMAAMASGFQMRILVPDTTSDRDGAAEVGAELVSYDDLLSQSDFISLHVALNDDTFRMFGADEFARMKSTAILINAARGRVVDTNALVSALSSGQILAAGLDVSDPEPLPADHPLVSLPNCIVAPHIASATVQTRTAMAIMAARNLVAHLNGETPPYLVNPDIL